MPVLTTAQPSSSWDHQSYKICFKLIRSYQSCLLVRRQEVSALIGLTHINSASTAQKLVRKLGVQENNEKQVPLVQTVKCQRGRNSNTVLTWWFSFRLLLVLDEHDLILWWSLSSWHACVNVNMPEKKVRRKWERGLFWNNNKKRLFCIFLLDFVVRKISKTGMWLKFAMW